MARRLYKCTIVVLFVTIVYPPETNKTHTMSEEHKKEMRILIDTIVPNKANFDYCSENQIINGSLRMSIKRIMRLYADFHHQKEMERKLSELEKENHFPYYPSSETKYNFDNHKRTEGLKLAIEKLRGL